MPNHITNIIKAPREVLEALTRTRNEEELESLRKEEERIAAFYAKRGEEREARVIDAEERVVDFELLIPPPEDLYRDGCDMRHPHPKEGGGYHSACWYDWNRTAWGTKWNGYDAEIDLDGGVVKFETAWSHPEPVIVALSQKFPEAEIDVCFADEDFGSNLGRYTIKDGTSLGGIFPAPGSDEANEMAAQILRGMTYAEVKAEWDAAEIDSTRREVFCKHIEAERGIDNGYAVIREEKLEIPQDIIDQIQTIEDARKYRKVSA